MLPPLGLGGSVGGNADDLDVGHQDAKTGDDGVSKTTLVHRDCEHSVVREEVHDACVLLLPADSGEVEPVEDPVLVEAELVRVIPVDPDHGHDGGVLLARGVDAHYDRSLVPRRDDLHGLVAQFVQTLRRGEHTLVEQPMKPVCEAELVTVLAYAEHLLLDELLVVLVPLGDLLPVDLEVVLPTASFGGLPFVYLDRVVERTLAVGRGADEDHGCVGGRTHRADGLVDHPRVCVLTLVHQHQVVGPAFDVRAGVGRLTTNQRPVAQVHRVSVTLGHLLIDVGVCEELLGPLGGESGDDTGVDDLGLVVGGGEAAYPEPPAELVQQVGEHLGEDGEHDHARGDGVCHYLGLT